MVTSLYTFYARGLKGFCRKQQKIVSNRILWEIVWTLYWSQAAVLKEYDIDSLSKPRNGHGFQWASSKANWASSFLDKTSKTSEVSRWVSNHAKGFKPMLLGQELKTSYIWEGKNAYPIIVLCVLETRVACPRQSLLRIKVSTVVSAWCIQKFDLHEFLLTSFSHIKIAVIFECTSNLSELKACQCAFVYLTGNTTTLCLKQWISIYHWHYCD